MSKYKYKYVRVSGRKIRIHRHIMEMHLGRQLRDDEYVYHINGNYQDNRIENLIVLVKNVKTVSDSDTNNVTPIIPLSDPPPEVTPGTTLLLKLIRVFNKNP